MLSFCCETELVFVEEETVLVDLKNLCNVCWRGSMGSGSKGCGLGGMDSSTGREEGCCLCCAEKSQRSVFSAPVR